MTLALVAVVRSIKNVAVDKRVGVILFEKAAKERELDSLKQKVNQLGDLL